MLNQDTQTIAGLQLHQCVTLFVCMSVEGVGCWYTERITSKMVTTPTFYPQRPNVFSSLPTRCNGRHISWKTLKARPGWGWEDGFKSSPNWRDANQLRNVTRVNSEEWELFPPSALT